MDIQIESKLNKLLTSNFKQLVIDTTTKFDFHQSNEAIRNCLLNLLQPHYSRVQIYLFGSRIIGTGTNISDLDIFLDIDQSFYLLGFNKEIANQLNKVYKLLLNSADEWLDPKIINAKIPIIKVVYRNLNINCDISFSDGIGHRNTELIKVLCDIQPVYKDLIICLRLWLECVELCKDINNYTLRLLVLHYFQHINLMPPIKLLQERIMGPLEIGPWNVDFDLQIIQNTVLPTFDDIRSHLAGFFKYYSSSNLTDNIICTYTGTLASKINFAKGNEIGFESYYEFVKMYKHETYQFSNMNIRGPFHLGQNPAKNVASEALQKFITLSKKSNEFLNSI